MASKCSSLHESYSLAQAEIEKLEIKIEGMEALREKEFLGYDNLKAALNEKIVSRRKWRKARTQIALLING